MDEIRFSTAQGRKYKYPGKTRGYPGVTTVIGAAWPAEYLEAWRIGNIAKRAVEHSGELSKRLKRVSKKPPKLRAMYATGLKETFIEWKDDSTAANRGTRIHQGLEHMLTADDAYDELYPDEQASVDTALAALQRFGVKIEHVEVPLYCHNPKYAGTADIIGTRKLKAGIR